MRKPTFRKVVKEGSFHAKLLNVWFLFFLIHGYYFNFREDKKEWNQCFKRFFKFLTSSSKNTWEFLLFLIMGFPFVFSDSQYSIWVRIALSFKLDVNNPTLELNSNYKVLSFSRFHLIAWSTTGTSKLNFPL